MARVLLQKSVGKLEWGLVLEVLNRNNKNSFRLVIINRKAHTILNFVHVGNKIDESTN